MFIVGKAEFARFMLRSFLFGTTSAAVYLLYGIFRIAFEKLPKAARVALTAIFDLAYCLALAFFGLLLVFKSNRGQMRISAMIFFAMGYALTVFAFGPPVYKLERKLLSGIYRRIAAPCLRRAKAVGRRCAARVRAHKKTSKEKSGPSATGRNGRKDRRRPREKAKAPRGAKRHTKRGTEK